MCRLSICRPRIRIVAEQLIYFVYTLNCGGYTLYKLIINTCCCQHKSFRYCAYNVLFVSFSLVINGTLTAGYSNNTAPIQPPACSATCMLRRHLFGQVFVLMVAVHNYIRRLLRVSL
jgi:hypothetical protein